MVTILCWQETLCKLQFFGLNVCTQRFFRRSKLMQCMFRFQSAATLLFIGCDEIVQFSISNQRARQYGLETIAGCVKFVHCHKTIQLDKHEYMPWFPSSNNQFQARYSQKQTNPEFSDTIQPDNIEFLFFIYCFITRVYGSSKGIRSDCEAPSLSQQGLLLETISATIFLGMQRSMASFL